MLCMLGSHYVHMDKIRKIHEMFVRKVEVGRVVLVSLGSVLFHHRRWRQFRCGDLVLFLGCLVMPWVRDAPLAFFLWCCGMCIIFISVRVWYSVHLLLDCDRTLSCASVHGYRYSGYVICYNMILHECDLHVQCLSSTYHDHSVYIQ
jgi:hypothetical protein